MQSQTIIIDTCLAEAPESRRGAENKAAASGCDAAHNETSRGAIQASAP